MTDTVLEQFFLDHGVIDKNREFAEKIFNENKFMEDTLANSLSSYKQSYSSRIDLHINQQFDKSANRRGSKKFIQRFNGSTHFFEVDGVFVSYIVLFRKDKEDFATTDFVLTPIKTDRGLLYVIFRGSGYFHESFKIVVHSHVFDRMVSRGPYLTRKNAIAQFMGAMIGMKMLPKTFPNNRYTFENDTVVMGLNGDAILGNKVRGVNYMKTFITQDMFGGYQKEDFINVKSLNDEFNQSFQDVKERISKMKRNETLTTTVINL